VVSGAVVVGGTVIGAVVSGAGVETGGVCGVAEVKTVSVLAVLPFEVRATVKITLTIIIDNAAITAISVIFLLFDMLIYIS
jgi:hypothetical protein